MAKSDQRDTDDVANNVHSFKPQLIVFGYPQTLAEFCDRKHFDECCSKQNPTFRLDVRTTDAGDGTDTRISY